MDGRWDVAFERECNRLIVRVCDVAQPDPERDAAWRSLLTLIAPPIERWAARSPVLARCGLTSEDEPRAVLVGVLTRLASRRYDNLQRYLARKPPDAEDDVQLQAIDRLARLGRLVTSDPEHPESPGSGDSDADRGAGAGDDSTDTRFRAWLLTLVAFAAKDHVRQRFGWHSTARVTLPLEAPSSESSITATAVAGRVAAVAGVVAVTLTASGTALVVDYAPGTIGVAGLCEALAALGFPVGAPPDAPRTKRDLGTDADRLDDVAETGERPRITDYLTLRRLIARVVDHMATFPPSMRQSLELWLDDADFGEIATRLGLEGAEKARALVRAGQARLRERFRGEWPGVAA